VTHNYGDQEFPVHENFQWVFDLSTATLADGCIGLISLTNNNWSSNLQFTFGNVYLTGGSNLYAGTLSGDYVADDSYVLDFSTDPSCTSIDMTAVTNLPSTLPWLEGSNRVVYVSGNCELSGTNVVKEGVCASLVIDERFGPFHPAQTFTATQASYTCEVDGQHIVQIPFQAVVPEGVNAYILTENLTPVAVTEVAANQPLLVEGHGVITFLGSGEVSYASQPLSDDVLPIETPTAIRTVRHILSNQVFYDLHGKRINTPYQGIIIRNGKKYVNK
jgi:glucuronoarabinoxylan endo-1,4-beta-xylanase